MKSKINVVLTALTLISTFSITSIASASQVIETNDEILFPNEG